MTDAIQRLVGHAMGTQTSSVRLRAPARFEKHVAEADMQLADHIPGTQASGATAPETRPDIAPGAEISAPHQNTHDSHVPGAAPSRIAPRNDAPSGSPQNPLRGDLARQVATNTPESGPEASPPASAPIRSPLETAPQSDVSEPADQTAPNAGAATPLPAGSLGPKGRSAVAPDPEDNAPPPRLLDVLDRVAAHIEERNANAAETSDHASMATSTTQSMDTEAPEISVHIGRIEVRSGAAQAPRAPTRAPRPALPSLSDYLNGGHKG